ncbi:MAG TPA: plastocyanin/azurin family copper-binding protein [Solirubrobacterales bacterium]|jgi:plastocyanin|nr:plastocyanin/azurin family copper-binding protein [Solirubrobacterales bacterium]
MRLKMFLAPALILLTFGLVACGGDGGSDTSTEGGASEGTAGKPGGEAARAEKVRVVDFFYDPDPVTVQVGGKVIWQNEDTIPHTATAEDGSFDTGTIEPGKLKSETFKQAGTYRYVCEIHPRMSGTVEVVEKD